MTLQNVSTVGNTVFVNVVFTKAEGQDDTPVEVDAAVQLAHEGTLVDPDPTPTVAVVDGVVTVVFSHAVDRDNDLAGRWDFGIVTSGDLVAAYDGSFFMDAAPVLDAS